MKQDLLTECADITVALCGNEPLYFDDPVIVKINPHTNPLYVWAVCVSPEARLLLMNSDEEWHELSLQDTHSDLVVATLYQRLQLIRIRYAKAS
jgi:hypothetical protein